jgi:hypothetical protein
MPFYCNYCRCILLAHLLARPSSLRGLPLPLVHDATLVGPLYRSSRQTCTNPSPLGECHDNRLHAGSHQAVPEFVSPGEACPTTFQKLHRRLWRRPVLTASGSIIAVQICFCRPLASTYPHIDLLNCSP